MEQSKRGVSREREPCARVNLQADEMRATVEQSETKTGQKRRGKKAKRRHPLPLDPFPLQQSSPRREKTFKTILRELTGKAPSPRREGRRGASCS